MTTCSSSAPQYIVIVVLSQVTSTSGTAGCRMLLADFCPEQKVVGLLGTDYRVSLERFDCYRDLLAK